MASLLFSSCQSVVPTAAYPPGSVASVSVDGPEASVTVAPAIPDASTTPVHSDPVRPESLSRAPVLITAPVGDVATAREPPRLPTLFPGTGQLINAAPREPVSDDSQAGGVGLQLAFENVEISGVAATVLGEGLGLSYTIDPAVKGAMTLQSTRPLARDDVLAALEAALRLQDVALVESAGSYRVVPMKDAPRMVAGIRAPAAARLPGYAVQIVPLQFVSAAEMEKILQPFAPQGAVLRVDSSRNLLVLAASGADLAVLQDVIRTFDTDWLAGMSFGLYPLTYVDAPTLANELGEIFSDATSPLAGVVRLVPLARLNSILVITPQTRYLTDVETWIRRLDLGGTTPGRRIYVYDVQYGKAVDLATSLSKILTLTSGTEASGGGAPNASASTNASRATVGANGTTGLGPSLAGSENDVPRSAVADFAVPGGDTLKIVPNEETNALLIYATPSEFSVVDSALQRLDQPVRQVLIEASLAEVTLTDDLRYGVQWSYEGGDGPLILSESGSGGIAQRFPGFSYLFTGRPDIRAVLNSIESVTKVRVISSPKLLVLNNREAQLQIGDQVPVVTQSAVGTVAPDAPIVNSVSFRDTGVILRVTPRANKNGMVYLDIAQEISDVVPTTTSGIDSPTIQQRKLSTTVAVRDGETIALGGLIRERNSKSRSGVPLLSKIPALGALFRSTNDAQGRTELIMLITPRVLDSPADTRPMLEDLRNQFRRLRTIRGVWPSSPEKQSLVE
ncbi:MAG: type II secretion system secretin GspD [Steroidobacteraceae bacterium]